MDKVSLFVRDNAANVTAAFSREVGLASIGCLTHSLQLCLKYGIFKQPGVTHLLEKLRKLCTHANHSDQFTIELKKQQVSQLQSDKGLILLQDVVTRWDSTYIMVDRCYELKLAIIPTLLAFPELNLEFRASDWVLMEKIISALKPFHEATKWLSKSDASISMCIPIVTTIMKQLETKKKDQGIKTMKRALLEEMEKRFAELENKEEFILATFLDTRFRGFMFRNVKTLKLAKNLLSEKLQKVMSNQSTPIPNEQNDNEISSISLKNNNLERQDTLEEAMNNIIQKSLSQDLNVKNEIDEFINQYTNSPPEQNVFEYWHRMSKSMNPLNRAVADLAAYYLTPPPGSVDVERLFSTAGDILRDERNRLKPENAAMMLFLRENLPLINFDY